MNRVSLVLAVGLVLVGVAATADTTVVVSPGNLDGWELRATSSLSNAVGGDGAADLVAGPATPPLGVGSAHLYTGTDGSQSAQLRNSDWAGTRLDALTSLGYSTFATSWNGQQLPYLTLYLENTVAGGGTDRLWFEPDYTAPAALNTWQSWDVLSGNVYSDAGGIYGDPGSNAITFASYLALNPNASIRNDGALGGIRVASGFASDTDIFEAYVDKFQIGTSAGITTYDFEPTGAPIPEPVFFQFGALMGLSGLGVLKLRRR